ncbi:hypothetical protein [Engelhardtia mirabilis]|uniref:Uncharacterized protein n=1 Tax=Engelhardtia mirabilis TaxID=2528011 RepID=A0A518BI10_9BACT|nr:hypothetical protein Pla133_16950 [Planctomycetes bacterium Pla133]QDV00945.1 hypothetical protein Pla86_16940 [Planctomycetes bacterium Pla86]
MQATSIHPAPWAELRPTEGRGEAWRQAHRAALVIGEVGMLWGQTMADHRHLATTYLHGPRALVGCRIRGERDFHVGLRLASPGFVVLDDKYAVLQTFDLVGRTIFEARKWLLERAEKLVGGPARNEAHLDARLDAHPLMEGAPFGRGCEEGFCEVDRAYSNADAVLRRILGDIAPGTAVRCWPHHFDIAALVELDSDGDEPMTIGLGMAPADDRQDRAYLYASPWPHPRAGTVLPPLAHGTWLEDGAPLAVLPIYKVAEAGSGALQARMAEEFLRSAYEACEQALEG